MVSKKKDYLFSPDSNDDDDSTWKIKKKSTAVYNHG